MGERIGLWSPWMMNLVLRCLRAKCAMRSSVWARYSVYAESTALAAFW